MRTVSRRAVLGGGVLAAGGTAAVLGGLTDRGRRWLHRAGLVDGPDLAAPSVDAPVSTRTLGSVPWRLYVPPSPVKALVVCLHGRNGDESFAMDEIGVPRFVADAGHPWAVVSVDGGATSYWHRRADGSDPQSMVFDELVPLVLDEIGSVPVVLLGWSMGGYGALLAAAQRTGEVAAVAASSPALWRSFSAAAPGAFDDERDFAANDVFDRLDALRALPVRLDCGRDDPFVANVRALAAALDGAESSFGDGFHEAATWRSFVPAQLTFFARSLG